MESDESRTKFGFDYKEDPLQVREKFLAQAGNGIHAEKDIRDRFSGKL